MDYDKLKKKYDKIKKERDNAFEYLYDIDKRECGKCNSWTDRYNCLCDRCYDSFCDDECKTLYLMRCIECNNYMCQKCIYPYDENYEDKFDTTKEDMMTYICNECKPLNNGIKTCKYMSV